ncbi:MAG: c-type cytochrome [Gammaproteobacteria bacterium]|nr:c-type cytochrome [Gammaproteobacteria bacterium]
MKFLRYFVLQVLLTVYLSLCSPLVMASDDADMAAQDQQMIMHLLNYVAGDYRRAVADGMVLNWDEYAEQQEFSGNLLQKIRQLPNRPGKRVLEQKITELVRLIDAKAAPQRVADLCKEISLGLIETYDVSIAPQIIPLLSGVKALYMENCAACHGDSGKGNGIVASRYTPTPTNFSDATWQGARSLYAIYNSISLGVNGTAMRSFSNYSDEQRWMLAFYVSGFADNDMQRQQGRLLWQQQTGDPLFPDISSVTNTSTDEVREHYGEEGVALFAYLRANPESMNRAQPSEQDTLLFSIRELKVSRDRYLAGDVEQAQQYAISAYLEGFELAENGLRLIDSELALKIEREMAIYRSLIKKQVDTAQVVAQVDMLEDLLHQASNRMSSTSLSPAMIFFSAMLILLREGVEAILVLAAIAAFLVKTERRDGLRYLHAGWVIALLAGGVTWYVASHVVSISGASRELTEGIAALVAAVMLLYVGYWLHSLAHSRKWQLFIHEKVNSVLGQGTLWGIAFISFLAVYREVFETVLFYQTLWLQSGEESQSSLLAGMSVGAVILVFVAWLIFKFSARLPLRLFFNVNAVLLFVLAVIFSGKGIAAMQEAGIFSLTMVDFPRIDLLGVYPSQEGLLTQGILVFSALAWVLYQRVIAKS